LDLDSVQSCKAVVEVVVEGEVEGLDELEGRSVGGGSVGRSISTPSFFSGSSVEETRGSSVASAALGVPSVPNLSSEGKL
jgi:hypothetical protein